MPSQKGTKIWAVLLFSVLLSCITLEAQAAEKGRVTLAYVEWSSEIASTNLVRAVLEEKMDYECEIIPMQADEMWQAVAKGEIDGMLSAWLPETQKTYYEEYSEDCVDLGPNLEGAKTGLVVPNVTLGRQTAATGLRN
jgi:glycine betaine/proline transport system substrate-binding protein